MKTMNKTVRYAVALLVALAFGACTEYDEPVKDDPIDIDFLSSLERLDGPAVFYLQDIYPVEKVYDPSDGTGREWHESAITGWVSPRHSRFMVMDGSVWRTLKLEKVTSSDMSSAEKSILYYPWKYYCKETGFAKSVQIVCDFEIDITNKRVEIDKCLYDIEKASGNEFTISRTSESMVPDPETYQPTPGLLKFVLCYIRNTEGVVAGDYLFFDTAKDAKLAMVKMMRVYFGDTVDLGDYADEVSVNPIIDLAEVESYIREGRDELY